MKSLWALLSTLSLTATIVVSGVAAGAAAVSRDDASESTEETTVTTVASLVTMLDAEGISWPTAYQAVLPGMLLVSRGATHHGSHGTRSDREFYEISSTGDNDVPEAALRAYRHAEKVMATADPGCDISWTLLAAIGRVESNHGRFAGAQLGSDGVSRPEIRGPELNGAGPFAAIHDSDHGTLDHDPVWDRAVGQMQFLPQTWRSVARDGDGDGQMNPDDIDDSALGSAVYLCGAGGSLAGPTGMARAAFRYNHSDYYVQLVLSFVSGYQTGVFAEPSPPPPPTSRTKARTHTPRVHKTHRPSKPDAKPTPAPKPTPTPTPTPTPKPAPTPSGPTLVQAAGTWNACGPGFCLGTTALDLGSASVLGGRAGADLDGDGSVETNHEEFTGLVGEHVVLQVERTAGGFVVYVVDGHGYRNADGSFARTAGPTAAPAAASPSAAP